MQLTFWSILLPLLTILAFVALIFVDKSKNNNIKWFYLYNKELDKKDYIFTFLATNISVATVFLALSEQSAINWIYSLWIILAWLLGILLFYKFFDKISQFTENGGVSLHQYIGDTFESILARRFAAILTIIAFTGTIALELFAVGKLLNFSFGAKISSDITSLGFIFLTASIVFAYSALTGYFGVVKSDKLQTLLTALMAGIIFYTIFFSSSTAVDLSTLFQKTPSFKGFDPSWAIAILILMVPFQISALDMWQRCAALDADKTLLKKALPLSGLLFSVFWLIPILVGLYVSNVTGISDYSIEFIGVEFLRILPAFSLGIVLSGLIASAMSTIDTLLVLTSFTIIFDLLSPVDISKKINELSNHSKREADVLISSRLYMMVVMFVAVFIAVAFTLANIESSIYKMIIAFLGVQIILFIPLFFKPLKNVSKNKLGGIACATMLVGGLTTIMLSTIGAFADDKLVVDAAPIAGFLFALAIYWCGSYYVSKQKERV